MDSGRREHDVVVVGGGPAGVSAALECVDMKLDTVLLEARSALGGQLVEISHSVRNVATGWYADGPALQAGLQSAAETLGSRVLLGHPVSTAGIADGWVEASGRRFRGRAILIASGSAPQRLPAAPDGAFGGDVTYELGEPPERFAGRPVAVVGGGDSATLDALALAETASSVLLVHRSESLTARHNIVAQVRAEPRIVDLPGWEVASARGGKGLEELELVRPATGDRQTVVAGGLVVKVSRVAATSRPGVFATGDVVAGAYWRVAYALGQGILAARSILRHLEASL
jgi:thioredoxin reductase (NADPH)